jgi:PKD repeat protein
MKRLIYLSMAIVLLIGFLPAATAAQAPYAAGQEAAGQQSGIESVASDYVWSQTMGTYGEITGGAQVTTSCDDQSYDNYTIPFDFTFNGVAYTAISIQCNGFLAMGGSVSNSYYPISVGPTNNIISALGMNLQTNTTNSEIRLETLGTAPDRVVVVQWKNFRYYYMQNEIYNFQIRLHETSNLVEVTYGSFAEPYSWTAEIGLRGDDGTDYNNRTCNYNWSNSQPGTYPNSAVRVGSDSLPPSGLTWIWTPIPHVRIWPDQADATCPGSSKDYTLNVLNNSAAADTIDITLSGNLWPASVAPGSLYLEAGETGQVVVTANVPGSAVAGDSDTTTVAATAQGSGAVHSATVTTTAFGAGVPSVWEDRTTGAEPDLYWGHSYYYDGNVCVLGGLTGHPSPNETAEHWCYNIVSGTWSSRAPMLVALFGGAYGLIGDKFYVAGGFSYSQGITNQLQIYDIATDTWSTGAPLPSDRFTAASGVVGGKLYSAGGGTNSGQPDYPTDCPTYEYDPVANAWTRKADCPLQGGYGFSHGGGVGSDFHGRLFAGGHIGGFQGWYAFDPVANTWQTLANLPVPFTPLIVENPEDGKIYSLGGMSSNWYPYASTWEYDYAADTWTNLNLPLSIARGGALGPAHGSFGDPDFEGFWAEGGSHGLGGGGGALDPAPFESWLRGCYGCDPVHDAGFSWAPPEPVVDEVVTFGAMAQGTGPFAYAWDFGDGGGGGSGAVVTHSYAAPGDYVVTLTASNDCGSVQVQQTVTVSTAEIPDVSVSPASLDAEQCSDTQTQQTLSICNNGTGELTWSLSEELTAARQEQSLGGNPKRLGATPPAAVHIPLELGPEGDVILDGGFEAGTPNPYWAEYSTNVGTPLCTLDACGYGGGTGPHTGDWWAWFGGIPDYFEEGYVSQPVTIPSGTATLSFWLEVPTCSDPGGYMKVFVDDTEVFAVFGDDPLCNLVGYVQKAIDVSAFADGGVHTVKFYSVTSGNGYDNFFVDDVALDASGPGIPWLSESPASGTLLPGECVDVTVTFDSTGLARGPYTGNLLVDSNDPDTPQVAVPVQMTVVSCCEPPSSADFSWDPLNPVVVEEITFTGSAQGSEPLAYAWDWGDGGTATGNPVTHAYAAPGDYLVTLTVSNDCGSMQMQHTVHVYGGPVLRIEPESLSAEQCPDTVTSQSFQVCNDGDLDLVWAVETAPSWVSWTPSSGTVLPGQCQEVSSFFDSAGLAPGTYSDTIHGTWWVDSFFDVFVELTVLDPVHDTGFDWTPANPVAGETVTFQASALGTEPLAYDWDLGDGNTALGPVVTHAYAAPGTYVVTLTASNECGQQVVTHEVVVVSGCEPVHDAAFTFSPDFPVPNQVVDFLATAQGDEPISYAWDLGDGTVGSGPEFYHAYTYVGTYLVTLTASNACGQQVLTHEVVVQPPQNLYLHLWKTKMAWAAVAQPYYKVVIRGFVHDQDHAMLGGATVTGHYTYPDGTTETKTAVTDMFGRWKVPVKKMMCGLYRFDIDSLSKPGYIDDPAHDHSSRQSEMLVPCK